MNQEQIKAFIAVVEEKSFSKAAHRLYQSQPAISQKISLLEKDLGCLLVERSRQGVKLTAQGELLYAETKAMENKMADLRYKLKHLHETRGGHLRIACSDTVGAYFLPNVLEKFIADNPQTLLTAQISVTSKIIDSILAEDIDFGFFLKPESDPRITEIKVLEYSDVLVLPEGHPLAEQANVKLSELLEERLLLPGRNTMTRKLIETTFHQEHLELPESQEAGSVGVLKEFVRIGLGVGICPGYAIGPTDNLVKKELGSKFKRQIVLGYRQDRYLSAQGKEFLRGF